MSIKRAKGEEKKTTKLWEYITARQCTDEVMMKDTGFLGFKKELLRMH